MGPIPKESKLRRSKNGCIHCRKLRKKCDEIKPICTSCIKSNRVCKYRIQEKEKEGDSLSLEKNDVMSIDFFIESFVKRLLDNGDHHCYKLYYKQKEQMIGSIIKTEDGEYDEILNFIDESLFEKKIPKSLNTKLPSELTKKEFLYFEFCYLNVLPRLCILPQEQNFYTRAFIPLALQDKTILYSLIAWGCRKYKMDELNFLIEDEECEIYIKKCEELIEYNIQNLSNDRNEFIVNLSSLMIFVLMEISFGDVEKWAKYFTKCFNLINKMPNRFKYLISECSSVGQLLADNFAYIDIMASQSTENGTFYPISDYNEITTLKDESNPSFDPLQGCLRPLNLLIGEVVNLVVEDRLSTSSFSDMECDKHELMSRTLKSADELCRRIEFAKPDFSCLMYLNDNSQFEQHLTLFEVYQLAAQIYIREVVKKLPPIVPEIEILYSELRSSINILMGSKLDHILGFPMLILGVSSIGKEDRREVREWFLKLIQTKGYVSGYHKLWTVVQGVWELNREGTLHVDWFKITKNLGWRLNLSI